MLILVKRGLRKWGCEENEFGYGYECGSGEVGGGDKRGKVGEVKRGGFV